jgi:tripartite-type tricarboxylate transporter receptor subunit TctC
MPIVATPGTPQDRVKMLREAYWKMFSDPEFVEDMTKKNWEPRPVNGEELAGLAKEVVNQPPDVSDALIPILSK